MYELKQPPQNSPLADICRHFHAQRLSLFGSAARNELRDDSDVDLLVEFQSDSPPSFFTLVEMSEALSPLFDGRTIDLVTSDSLHKLIRHHVSPELKTLYER